MSLSPILLIHGWGANGRIFSPLRAALPPERQARTGAPDLPGHGEAGFNGVFDIAAIADDFAARLDRPAHIVGWSLGGMVALAMAARHPQHVRSLCLTASAAKIPAAADYPQGLKRMPLAAMIDGFRADYAAAMHRFIELQLLYTPEKRHFINEWSADVAAPGAPAALEAALAALESADWRAGLPEIRCPVLLVYGGKDALTPVRMGEYLHRHLPKSRLHIIDKAAHAPFLSHSDEMAATLIDFWKHCP
ncbi:pimeloyl-[acyl-carrier protein] methyl ester esterase [Neisseria sp. HSC-16F19]|nr:pimeloyl-[acyl-carrier protein] methyl ester esterase [Neisseria sp. HSC-16F19]